MTCSINAIGLLEIDQGYVKVSSKPNSLLKGDSEILINHRLLVP
jgi:hypothetical protein